MKRENERKKAAPSASRSLKETRILMWDGVEPPWSSDHLIPTVTDKGQLYSAITGIVFVAWMFNFQ
jgi:hypothetical protein